jgi:hypothetical protein
MSHHFTKLASLADADAIVGPATIVCNVSQHAVYVDEEMQRIGPGGYAAIRQLTPMIQKALSRGNLEIVKNIESPVAKPKPKQVASIKATQSIIEKTSQAKEDEPKKPTEEHESATDNG